MRLRSRFGGWVSPWRPERPINFNGQRKASTRCVTRRRPELDRAVNLFANLMVRVLYERNYGVYVNDERGAQHHRAHAHITHRGSRIASFYLETLQFIHGEEQVPGWLRRQIAEAQEQMVDRWLELNG